MILARWSRYNVPVELALLLSSIAALSFWHGGSAKDGARYAVVSHPLCIPAKNCTSRHARYVREK